MRSAPAECSSLSALVSVHTALCSQQLHVQVNAEAMSARSFTTWRQSVLM